MTWKEEAAIKVAARLVALRRGNGHLPVEVVAALPFLVWGLVFGAYVLAVIVSLSAGTWIGVAVSVASVMVNAYAVFSHLTGICWHTSMLVMKAERPIPVKPMALPRINRPITAETYCFDDEPALAAK